jgi:dCTP diphosphatase
MIRSLDELRARLREFTEVRDWSRFHSPKNLSMALIAEAAELVEHFQWRSETESGQLSPEERAAVELEMADVLLYLAQLADRLDVDLLAAAERKMALNEAKYPAASNRGAAPRKPG